MKHIELLTNAILSEDKERLQSTVEKVQSELKAVEQAKRMLNAIKLGKDPFQLPPLEKEVQTMSDVLVNLAAELNGEQEPPVPSGIPSLDDLMGGIAPSELLVVGGRPGDGKTSLALSIALNAAKADYPVIVFSFEQPAREIVNKLTCMNSSCPFVPVGALRSIRTSPWSPERESSYLTSAQQIEQLPIFVYDLTPSMTKVVEHIEATKLRVAGHGCKSTIVVVVDYIQLFPTSESSNRTESLSEVSRAMKQLAKEHQCAIILVSQLNRESTKRDNVWEEGIPACMLRETGSLEQDADAVLMVVRKEDTARLHLVKMRAGKTGFAEVSFNETITRFS